MKYIIKLLGRFATSSDGITWTIRKPSFKVKKKSIIENASIYGIND